jgi:hypothetical protein
LKYHGAVLSVDHGCGKPGEIGQKSPALADQLLTTAGFCLYCGTAFDETILSVGFEDGEGFDDDPFFCRSRNFNLFAFFDFSAGDGAGR